MVFFSIFFIMVLPLRKYTPILLAWSIYIFSYGSNILQSTRTPRRKMYAHVGSNLVRALLPTNSSHCYKMLPLWEWR